MRTSGPQNQKSNLEARKASPKRGPKSLKSYVGHFRLLNYRSKKEAKQAEVEQVEVPQQAAQ